MIEKYWNEMFKDFLIGHRKFHIEDFPDPLLSPHFGETNIVGERARSFKFHYMLCCFYPLNKTIANRTQVETLEQAIKKEAFWNFHLKEKNESLAFMRRFLPFLVEHKRPHWHFYIEKEGEIISSVIVGETSKIVLGFNALVSINERKQGTITEVSDGIRSHFKNHHFFYWTKHAWFKNHCDQTLDYYIV